MMSLMIRTAHPTYLGDQMEQNYIGMACSTYGGKESCVQGF